MSFPSLHRSLSRRIGVLTLSVGLLVGLGGITSIGSASAATVADGNPFNGADGVKDALAGTALPDRPTGTTDNSYTGGAKEDDPCPTVGTGSIPPQQGRPDQVLRRHRTGNP